MLGAILIILSIGLGVLGSLPFFIVYSSETASNSGVLKFFAMTTMVITTFMAFYFVTKGL